MMTNETPGQAFRRQRWEHALGASRVALDALREVWPAERTALPLDIADDFSEATREAERLVITLEDMSLSMIGKVMVGVLVGSIRSQEDYDAALAAAGDSL